MPPEIDQIKAEMIENYVLTKASRLKPATVNLFINTVKSFYAWICDEYGARNIVKSLGLVPSLPQKTADHYKG